MDFTSSVSIPRSEYEKLIKEEQQLETLKSYMQHNKYLDKEFCSVILDIEIPEVKGETADEF